MSYGATDTATIASPPTATPTAETLAAFFAKAADGYTLLKPEFGNYYLQIGANYSPTYMGATSDDKTRNYYMLPTSSSPTPGTVYTLLADSLKQNPAVVFFAQKLALVPATVGRALIGTVDPAMIRKYAADPDFFYLGGARPALTDAPAPKCPGGTKGTYPNCVVDSGPAMAGLGPVGTVALVAGGAALVYYFAFKSKKPKTFTPNRRGSHRRRSRR